MAASTRTSTFFDSRPPTRRISLSSSTRSSLAWRSSGRSPISSSSRVPSCASSNSPARSAVAPVKRPAHVAEQLALEQVLRNGGAVDGGEALLAPRAHPVDGAGQHFLAGAALAGDEHGGAVARHAGGQVEQVAHRAALAHHEIAGGAGAEAGAQHLHLAAELLALLGLPERHRDFVGAERLVEVVVGAFAHGGEGAVLAAVRAHHDQQRLAAVGAVAAEKGHAVHLGHPDVAENEVEGPARWPACRACSGSPSVTTS